MSLEKSIKSGREHRKPFRGSKAFDPSCRNNTCPACLSNKLNSSKKRLASSETKMKFEEMI